MNEPSWRARAEAAEAEVRSAELRELAALRGSVAKDAELVELRLVLRTMDEELARSYDALSTRSRQLGALKKAFVAQKSSLEEAMKELARLRPARQGICASSSASETIKMETVDHTLDSDSCNQTTRLIRASYRGRLDLVQSGLKEGSSIEEADNHGRTAVFYAAEKGHLNIVEYLIGAGAKFNSQDNSGETPLHVASWYRRLDVVQFLLDHGAEVNICSKYGDTPLSWACCRGSLDIVKVLLDHGAPLNPTEGSPPLTCACTEGYLDIVKELLSRGAPLEMRDSDPHNWTALHAAASCNRPAVVAHLISQGADVNAKDTEGRTARDLGLERGFRGVVRHFETLGK